MNLKKNNILFLFVLLFIQIGYAQNFITEKNVLFDLEVRVVDKSNNLPIKDAKVSAGGINFRFSSIKDVYMVRAMVGQQLIISHYGFDTYYYTIKSNEEIKLEVKDFNYSNYKKKYKKKSLKPKDPRIFFKNYDSAFYYKEKDIEKSISFIENILKDENTDHRFSITYKLLGDIYVHWKQYDLAISDYKLSLFYKDDEYTKLALVKAFLELKDVEKAEQVLLSIDLDELVVDQQISGYESLGDVYLEKKNFSKAKKSFRKALKISQYHDITSKVTDLNSKMGDVSAAEGNVVQANLLFKTSIDLATKENKVRSLEEKEKVANYFNQTQQFDKEINLRKETLKETNSFDSLANLNTDQDDKDLDKKISIETDSYSLSKTIIPGVTNSKNSINSVNSQSINYKIGRALVEKEDYKGAIPFLENSIKDADANNDLIVKKDATRKLSEVYASVGDYDKALSNYQDYVTLVDTLYNRKEQEITRATRFATRMADNKNRIASLEKDRALNDSKIELRFKEQLLVEEENRNQLVLIYSLSGGIFLMCIFAYLLFKNNKQQKLANNLLALKSMRSQMNPHFIFNALNSVNSFIAVNDERNANRYLSEFSVLMRSVLENSDEDFISLPKELELLELYLKLEHNRFKEKFDYEIAVDNSIKLEEFSIPPMLLQPYIENAIWHGLRYKEEKGSLEISVKPVDSESISVIIKDDGVGRKRSIELKTKNQLKQKSKGMSTIQNRIAILNDMYQDRIDVQVSDAFEDGTGTKVELLLKKK
jgi:tetratricopeptide (TPR) repeat protein